MRSTLVGKPCTPMRATAANSCWVAWAVSGAARPGGAETRRPRLRRAQAELQGRFGGVVGQLAAVQIDQKAHLAAGGRFAGAGALRQRIQQLSGRELPTQVQLQAEKGFGVADVLRRLVVEEPLDQPRVIGGCAQGARGQVSHLGKVRKVPKLVNRSPFGQRAGRQWQAVAVGHFPHRGGIGGAFQVHVNFNLGHGPQVRSQSRVKRMSSENLVHCSSNSGLLPNQNRPPECGRRSV